MTAIPAKFSEPTRRWFGEAFGSPTPAQEQAWEAISTGLHTLVVAPTGSGKTLAAFLWAIDRLAAAKASSAQAPDRTHHDGKSPGAPPATRVVYVSPLKALAVDIERNLNAPLAGIAEASVREGHEPPPVTVGVRSGDTTSSERRRLVRTPPDILITTPESLYLMLTSAARQTLTAVETVIVDEVHSVAGTKRGAHLAVSLERLDMQLDRPSRRIGLSATARPHSEVARFLGGAADVHVVAPAQEKRWDLSVRVPVDDMTAPPPRGDGPSGVAAAGTDPAPVEAPSIWPHLENEIADLIEQHSSTIVFTNSRRLTERLTARLNEIHADRSGLSVDREGRPPALLGSPTEVAYAHPAADAADAHPVSAPDKRPSQDAAREEPYEDALFARAHHGSVSKDRRARIEDDLKNARLRCVVATSSLELGIDMGEVDLVIQVESPPSVASGLQRIGRSGHHVGDVSKGVLVPKHRADLLHCAVTADRMRVGAIEALAVTSNPLDVLAQQTIAQTAAVDTLDVENWFEALRRSAPFASLPRSAFDATLDMISGRYPSDEFAELRPRTVWDREAGTLTARPGAARLAVTSGGTIPDRGAFAVYTVGDKASRVGELDEEMVYESRVGDVFALGTTSWRVAEITHDRVLVTPAFGRAGRLPFWHGDGPGRPAEFGRAIGDFTREFAAAAPSAVLEGTSDGTAANPSTGTDPGTDAGYEARNRLEHIGLDAQAARNLLRLLGEQRAAVGAVPDSDTLVVERFRDELGDWRLVLHSPYGRPVHAPWALAVGARLHAEAGIDSHPTAFDDGIVLRMPDTTGTPPGAEVFAIGAEDIDRVVTDALGGSALFASRFRECAARALLLPRRDPGRRAPLWQQRHRSAQLLDVVGRHPDFPILHETVRECLHDVYDLPALRSLLTRLGNGDARFHEAETQSPSPFAASLLFDYIGTFIYDGDVPLAERRAAALTLDPALLTQLLGEVELSELLDPEVLDEAEDRLQWLADDRRARDSEAVADLLRVVGPLSSDAVERRTAGDPGPWLERLAEARRIFSFGRGGLHWAVVEDAARLRDGLGVRPPEWLPAALAESVADPLGDIVGRYARTHGPFTARAAAGMLGLGIAVVDDVLGRLARDGRVVRGSFRPRDDDDETGWCDAEVLRTVRRRSLDRARRDLEPVPRSTLGRFLPAWQHVARPQSHPPSAQPSQPSPASTVGGLRGIDGLFTAIDQLAGAEVPASALEPLVLAGRVVDYRPAMLDELTASGEVLWSGHGRSGARDGWVRLHTAESAPETLRPPTDVEDDPLHHALIEALSSGGGYFFRQLVDAAAAAVPGEPPVTDDAAAAALWDLVWSGHVTGDTVAPLRALLSASTRSRPSATSARRRARPRMPTRTGPPTVSGRWSMLPSLQPDQTVRMHDAAGRMLARYGVVTPGVAAAEGIPGGFAQLYRVLSRFEETGACRRGYLIDGLGGAQFAAPDAVDRLRAYADPAAGGSGPGGPAPTGPGSTDAVVLAAADPANPYGAALDWPQPMTEAHRPSRTAGALVVLVGGEPAVFVERGGRSLLTFTDDESRILPALAAIADPRRTGAAGGESGAVSARGPIIERVDGRSVHGDAGAHVLAEAGFRLTPRGYRASP